MKPIAGAFEARGGIHERRPKLAILGIKEGT